jgi:hypothetical protein
MEIVLPRASDRSEVNDDGSAQKLFQSRRDPSPSNLGLTQNWIRGEEESGKEIERCMQSGNW